MPDTEIPADLESEKITPEPITPDELISPLIESMPLPTVNNDAAPSETQAAIPEIQNASPETSVIKDNKGTVFDASKHAVDSKGNPRLNKRGRFISRFVGRPAGGKNGNKIEQVDASTLPQSEIENLPDAEPEKKKVTDYTNKTGVPDEYDNAAQMYLQLGYGVAVTTISDEWAPENDHEHEQLRITVAAYLRSKGEIKLTPEMALTIAILSYAGKRVTKPKTKEKLLILWLKIRSLFQRKQIA